MMRRNLAQSLHDTSLFDFLFQDFRGGDSRDSSTSFTALLASNLLAPFSRQILIQILGLESPKVCGNLAVRRRTLHQKNGF
jgi:hypothetical protein